MTRFIPSPPHALIQEAVARALAEDLGLAGDVTTNACIPADATVSAVINARAPGVIAGCALAREAFHQVDPSIVIKEASADGARVSAGCAVIELEGRARSILIAERVALNFLCHLSGIASATAEFVEKTIGTNASIVCTRKTTPTLRAFEKHAVNCGGGKNHRFGLFDAVMIKDNHIAACGGDINAAIARVRAAIGHTVKVEVEVDRLDQLETALKAGADIVLLDTMTTDELRTAVQQNAGRAILEASGGVNLDSVGDIAATGVDLISTGWITHSAPALDLGLDFK